MGATESTSRTNGTNQEEEERKKKSSTVVRAAATIAVVGVAAWGISRMLSDNTDTQENKSAMKMKMITEPSYVLEGKCKTKGIPWSPPPPGRFKMNTDGSHRHKEEYVGPEIDSAKLHPSGYGGILRDHNGKWMRGFIGYIGVTDNQTAELYGIHKGLELLDKLGYKGAILETDSKGAHEYVTRRDDDRGKKKSNDDSWGIILECRKLADKNNIKVLPIRRNANKCADRLAKIAIKKQVNYYEELIVLPDEIDHLVSEDAKFDCRHSLVKRS